MSYLLAHAVNAIGPQQVDGLFDKVCPSTVEHPEAQILQELGLCGGCIQLPCGTETIFSSVDESGRYIIVTKWGLVPEIDLGISRYTSPFVCGKRGGMIVAQLSTF